MKTLLAALLALGVAASASAGDRRSGDSDRRGDRDGGRHDQRAQSHDRRGRDDRHGHWRPGQRWDAWDIGWDWGWAAPGWSVGYSRGPGWYGRSGWVGSGWGWDDGWSNTVYVDSTSAWGVTAPAGTTNYAANGALLGGIAGAIIGHQDGHTGRGALIGTGAGLLLGAIADSAQRQSTPARVAVSQPGVVRYQAVEPEASALAVASAESTSASSKPTPSKAKPATRMAEANALFGR